jgi:probable F420-dependent oxidoreductase
VAVAEGAERLGYHSLWVFQRLLYPVAPKNEYYGAPGQNPWPAPFRSVLDPLVVLSFAAAVTRRARLGVSVLIMPFYNPVVLGKLLASLDVMSRGRLDVGLGIGWSIDELEAAGDWTPPGERADEFLRVLNAVWADDPAQFRGQFYTLAPSHVAPRPVQQQRPRLLVGGYADAVFRRAVTLADGYTGGNVPFPAMARIVARVRDAAERAGRDPAGVPIVCRGAFGLTPLASDGERRPLTGSIAHIRDDLAHYAEMGVTEMFLDPNFQFQGAPLEAVLDAMEALAPRA